MTLDVCFCLPLTLVQQWRRSLNRFAENKWTTEIFCSGEWQRHNDPSRGWVKRMPKHPRLHKAPQVTCHSHDLTCSITERGMLRCCSNPGDESNRGNLLVLVWTVSASHGGILLYCRAKTTARKDISQVNSDRHESGGTICPGRFSII